MKIIFDTTELIPLINRGMVPPVLEWKGEKPIQYMSAVVMAELYAGAFDSATIKLLDKIYDNFTAKDKLLTPQAGDWQKSGKIAAQMGQKYGFEEKYIAGINNDILIALSARRVGATVITRNVKDFLRIGEWVEVRVWEG